MLFFLPISSELRAQIDDVIEDLTTIDDIEAESWEQTYDLLSELLENPLNLNTATPDDLRELPFLSEEQIERISEYIHRYGALQSVGELAMIDLIDETTRQLLLRFTYLGEAEDKKQSFAEMLRTGQHELLATARVPFYERRGDKDVYLGPPYKHSLRYTFQQQRRLKAAFIGSQDAGEPFFTKGNGTGYDHYSFYVQAQRFGRLKNLTVGHYRLNFGQGLVINNDFAMGKLVAMSTADRNQNIIRGHSSRMEYNYLQGAAAMVSVAKNLDLTAFLSYRAIDMTPNSDSTQSIRTILTSGYHRTQSEMDRRRNATEFLAGSRLAYRYRRWNVAATVVYDAFDKPLKPVEKRSQSNLYREIYPEGQHFWNASVDYGYRHPRFSFNGETATGSCGGIATMNTLNVKLLGQLSLIAVQRFYSYRYYAIHSQSLSEGGSTQNESGILVGATWHPLRPLTITAYTDFAYFPWARYQVSQRSKAWDNLVSATWKQQAWKINLRYRLRLRERDNSDRSALLNRTEQRLRASVTYAENAWNLRTQLDMSHVGTHDTPKSFGWMVSEAAGFKMKNLDLSALVAYFHTDDYDSRLYLHERGPLYAFSFPMLYGHGIRYMLMAQWQPARRLLLVAKLATTNYFDRATISSGYQQIDASSMTDLDVQLKWRF